MNLQFGIMVGSVVFGFSALAFSLVCFSKNRKTVKLLDDLVDQFEELEIELSENIALFKENKMRAEDQARRIAWLETRIRKPVKVKKDILSQEVLTTDAEKPLNMTERRHRVLTLASRGQDAETIASTLGMLKGEVELIISLGRGMTAAA